VSIDSLTVWLQPGQDGLVNVGLIIIMVRIQKVDQDEQAEKQ